MSEELRYARHALLDGFSEANQQQLGRARVLIVGVGGLGCSAAQSLVAAGVGTSAQGFIHLVDADVVDTSNLIRQTLFSESDVGTSKVLSAHRRLLAIHSGAQITTDITHIDSDWLNQHAASFDLILDCSDNFATRDAINLACVQHRKPCVSAAAIRWTGQCMALPLHLPSSPCYHCIFPHGSELLEERCATTGVWSPVVQMMGNLQASLAMQLLIGHIKVDGLMLFRWDGFAMRWQQSAIHRDSECESCGRPSPAS